MAKRMPDDSTGARATELSHNVHDRACAPARATRKRVRFQRRVFDPQRSDKAANCASVRLQVRWLEARTSRPHYRERKQLGPCKEWEADLGYCNRKPNQPHHQTKRCIMSIRQP
jgi:hypothetical protein